MKSAKPIYIADFPQAKVTQTITSCFIEFCDRRYPLDDEFSFAHSWQQTALLKKFPTVALDPKQRKQAAIDSWRNTESQLVHINNILRNPLTGTRKAIISVAREKIRKLLGVYDLSELFADCRFTGGASYSLKRSPAMLQKKYGLDTIDITPQAVGLWQWRTQDTLLSLTRLRLTPGSRITTVPKNGSIDRTIEINPTGNTYLQKGLGSFFRRRLRRVGIDLNDQSKNREASRFTRNATLDLKAASDSISTELVCQLFEPALFHILDICRSQEVLIDTTWVRTEKFCSMGNCFTFELESLIFWAITSAAQTLMNRSQESLVYGDDIIVPCFDYPGVVGALSLMGFTVNAEKSFWKGPFRESCGGHFYSGSEVTPFYWDFIPGNWIELLLCCNKVLRWTKRIYGYYDYHHSLVAPLISLLPHPWRIPRIPDGLGDGALIGEPSLCTFRWNPELCQRESSILAFRSDKRHAPQYGGYVASLALEGSEGDLSTYSQEKSVIRVRKIAWA